MTPLTIQLLESPEIIPNLRLTLTDKNGNPDMARKLAKKVPFYPVVFRYNGLEVRRIRSKLFSLFGKRVAYFVELTNETTPFGPGIYQSLVWRDTALPATKNLSGHVMLEYLLPTHKVLVCDRQQTEGGHRLWMTIIPEALALGHEAFVWKGAADLKPIVTQDDIRDLEWGSWGVGTPYRELRILIRLKGYGGEVPAPTRAPGVAS